jgi:7-carboxy-7-deazaguanine synthase
MSKEYQYSEIFYSMQGEGHYTGVPTLWLRFFLCNLQCNGFGQKEPTKPETWQLPYDDLDVTPYKTMEELPVFQYGCDSSYSWSKKFKHLQRKGSASEIADRMVDLIKTDTNPEGLLRHPKTGQSIHMCFTGGEPLMKHAQEAVMELISYQRFMCNVPTHITFETNGTQALTPGFKSFFHNKGLYNGEVFFSISPKLWSVAGEEPAKAICPKIVAEYHTLSDKGQLKFVVNGTQEAWDEMELALASFRSAGVNYPVWIMPAGATVEGQKGLLEGHGSAGTIADEALRRGYNVSARVHAYLWDNVIGK